MQGENGSIDPLRFVGSRNKPLSPKEIAQMRPELGSGERPQDLEDLASRRSIYIHSESDDEPQVEVSRVEGSHQLALGAVRASKLMRKMRHPLGPGDAYRIGPGPRVGI